MTGPFPSGRTVSWVGVGRGLSDGPKLVEDREYTGQFFQNTNESYF